MYKTASTEQHYLLRNDVNEENIGCGYFC